MMESLVEPKMGTTSTGPCADRFDGPAGQEFTADGDWQNPAVATPPPGYEPPAEPEPDAEPPSAYRDAHATDA